MIMLIFAFYKYNVAIAARPVIKTNYNKNLNYDNNNLQS